MVSSQTVEVILKAKDQLSQTVDNVNNKIKSIGNSGKQAMDTTKNATSNATNAMKQQETEINTVKTRYDTLKGTVNNAFNSIKNTIKNSSPAQYINSESIAQPFKNGAEMIRQKWQTLTTYFKSNKVKTEMDNANVDQKLAELRTKISQINSMKASPRFDITSMKSADGEIRVVMRDLQNLRNYQVNLNTTQGRQALQNLDTMVDKVLQRANKLKSTDISPKISPAGLATLEGQITQISNSSTGLGSKLSNAFKTAQTHVQSFGTKLTTVKDKITNLASGMSGLQSGIMSAFAVVGVTSLKSFIIDSAIAREKVNAVTKEVAGSEQAFKNVNKSIKTAVAGTTLGYNNMAKAVNNVALRFHVTGNAVSNLAGPMAKVGILAQAMGKSSEEAASIMESAFDGLNDKWKGLKQIGITKEDLIGAGWSGAKEDVDGYARALDKVLEKNPKFKEFTNTFEYQFESFKMSVKGIGTEIGMILLPILKTFLNFLTDLSKEHPWLLKIAVVIGLVVLALSSIATAVLPLIMLISAIKEFTLVTTIWSAVTKVATAVQAALNVVLAMNPITLLVIAIVALIAILIYLYYTNEDVRNALNSLFEFITGSLIGAWDWLCQSLGDVWNWLVGIGEYLSTTFMNAWQSVVDFFTGIYEVLANFGTWINELWTWIVLALWGTIESIWTWALETYNAFMLAGSQAVWGFINWLISLPGLAWTWLWNTLINFYNWAIQVKDKAVQAGQNAVNGFIDWLKSLPGKAWTWLLNTLAKILGFGDNGGQKMSNAGDKMVANFILWIKQLPGKMWTELMNIGKQIVQASGPLVAKIIKLGTDMLHNFLHSLGIASPGHMAHNMGYEMGYIADAMTDNQSNLSSTAMKTGQSILDGFNKNDYSDITDTVNNAIPDTITGGTTIDTTATTTMTENLVLQTTANDDMTAYTESVTAMTGAVNPQLMMISGSLDQLGMSSTNQTLTTLANNQALVLGYNNMQTALTTSMNNIQNMNTVGWNNIKNVSTTSLNAMLTSTKNVTAQMVSAWNKMKDSIIQASEDIKSQSSNRFNTLWNTIKTFYNRIQHPGGAGAPTKRRATGGGTSGFKSFSNAIRNTLSNKTGNITRQVLINRGFSNEDIQYFFPYDTSRTSSEDIVKYINRMEKLGAGGWSSVVSPNVKWIKDTTNQYETAPPTIASRYKTSQGFKVKDFENGEPNITFSDFKRMAEDVFSQCHYEFYMDSSKYGNWITAFHGGGMNCSDSTDALLAMANACGLGGSKVHGYWNNIGHYWAEIAGHKLDTTGYMLHRNWTPAQSHAGPVPRAMLSNNDETVEDIYSLLLQVIDVLQRKQEPADKKGTIIHDGQVTLNVNCNFEGNVPEGVNAQDVANMLQNMITDRRTLQAITSSADFQELDRRYKNKITGEMERF